MGAIKQLIVVLSVALAMSIAACGEGNASKGSAIDVWAWGTEGELLKELTARFETEHPGITVNVSSIPDGSRARQDPHGTRGQSGAGCGHAGHDVDGRVRRDRSARPGTPGDRSDAVLPGRGRDRRRRRQSATACPGTSRRASSTTARISRDEAGITEAPDTWDELKAMARAMQAKGGARIRHLPRGRRTGWSSCRSSGRPAATSLPTDGSCSTRRRPPRR